MPKLLTTPFAADAPSDLRTDIQVSDGAAVNSATYQQGFPAVTMESITAGGVPPKGSDFNGIFYDITDNIVFQTQGNGYPFDADYSTSIGGYPLNARLQLDNGDIVRSTVASNTANPNSDMTGWVKVNSTKQIIDDIYNVSQSVINGNFITVDNFGAKGDGTTDDSTAFQAYCDSALTGANIRLACRKAVYIIKKQVNCKGKGIVGNGFGKQNETAYALGCIRVQAGDFSNTDATYNDIAFINVGAEVRDLQLKGDSLPTIAGLQVSGYNTTISNVNIAGFGNQVYVLGATVSFRVSDLMSISASNAGFYFKDQTGDQSTTAYFERCSWQQGINSVIFEKEAYGCSFKNIIIEYMNGGLKAAVWSNCVFDGIWAESTLDGAAHDWLTNTTTQQSFNNQYSNLYIRTPWTNRADPNTQAVSDNAGGIQLDNTAIAIASATGGKVRFDVTGLSTLFAAYAGASNNPLSTRALLLTTQDRSTGSNYDTPIVIAAPNGCFWERNRSATDYTPVTKRRLIGANADSTAAYYGVDSYTKVMRKWSTYNHAVSAAGQFIAPLFLTYDSGSTSDNQQNNAGWRITKESGSTGVYILQRTATTVTPMTNPHINVGGIFAGSISGTGAAISYSLQAIESYSGSWTTYREAAGFKIFFRDSTGAAIDIYRFTCEFVLASGF